MPQAAASILADTFLRNGGEFDTPGGGRRETDLIACDCAVTEKGGCSGRPVFPISLQRWACTISVPTQRIDFQGMCAGGDVAESALDVLVLPDHCISASDLCRVLFVRLNFSCSTAFDAVKH